MSIFDAQVFAQQTFTDANATESCPVPVGQWPGVIHSWEVKEWKNKDGVVSGLKLVTTFDITHPEVVEATGRDKNLVRYETFLDINPQTGIAESGKGKNVGLGRLREAVGLNTPGEPFNFNMLNGRQALVNVTHRPDSRDSSILYAEGKGVAAL